MRFLILHVHREDNKCFVTGCLKSDKNNLEELRLLEEIRECLLSINEVSFNTSHVVEKNETLFFRAVEANSLFTVLAMWNDDLHLNLRLKIGKNATFTGNASREKFFPIVEESKIKIDRGRSS